VTAAHMIRTALAMADSDSVCLETILPVVAHTSEQLRHMVIQRLMWETISSPRPASAQALHAWEQSKHASMHSMSASASMAAVPGWALSISLAWVIRESCFSRVCLTNTKRRQIASRESRFSGFCVWLRGYFERFRSPRNYC
jgi:hypothetical protein